MAEYDPTDIEANAWAARQSEDREKALTSQWESDIQWLMGGKRGRRVVFKVLDDAGVFRTTFNANALWMAFNEGKRNVGLTLIDAINSVCPETYQIMLQERGEI